MELEVADFSLDETLRAGQTFAWHKEDDSWFSFIDSPLCIRQKGPSTLDIVGCDETAVRARLGLNDDVASIKAEVDKDDFVDAAIRHSGRLRVVKEGLWPATLGFILSIQSNIPLIHRRVAALSKSYGEKTSFEGREMRSFPPADKIYEKGMEKLKELKLGFRTKFVFAAAEHFCTREISERLSTTDMRKELLEIKGVGDKVADCIMLYGLHDLSVFPMDVWILRVIEKAYGGVLKGAKNYTAKSRIMRDYFGRYAGYAQLYIYNYSRLNKIK